MKWFPLTTSEQLEFIDSQSFEKEHLAVAIFKHSTRCSISSVAKNRIESSWAFNEKELPIFYLDLLNYRALSNTISEKYGIEHESPQLLLIKNGKCIYHPSHNDIRSADVKTFLSA